MIAFDQTQTGFAPEAYRRSNVVERLPGYPRESRGVFCRYEKTAVNDLGTIHVACIRDCLAELV